MNENDTITFEHIEPEERPVIGIAEIEGKGYQIASVLTNPLEVAQILSGLATSILENYIGRNNRAHRFFGRG